MPNSLLISPADSLAMLPVDTVDTVATTAKVIPVFEYCHEEEAPTGAEKAWTTTVYNAYTSGVRGIPKASLPGYDTGVMTMLIAMFLILAVNITHHPAFFKSLAKNLWTVRNRNNAFDNHTVNETRVMMSLLMLTCICEGILGYCVLYVAGIFSNYSDVFANMCLCIGVAVAFNAFQAAAYHTIGFTFTSRRGATQWTKGFYSSQALLGLTLTLPALVALFNPGWSVVMATIGAVLYILARILFIYKGFRIFYHNFFSLIYFILYLCTVEIVPVLFLYKLCFFISNSD